MAGRGRERGDGREPGGVIASYAFRYSSSFFDFADEKYPPLKTYPPENPRGVLLQAAIIVLTLVLLERAAGAAGREERHAGVVRGIAPSARHRLLSAVRGLAASLLARDPAALPPGTIPPLDALAAAPDAALAEKAGVWVVTGAKGKERLMPPDLALAAAVGRSARTSAAMIVRLLARPAGP